MACLAEKYVLIYSDLKEELPKGFVRNFNFTLDGFTVKALNVTKLRSDNVNPQEYMDRLEDWQARVEHGGGKWIVVNDMEREDALELRLTPPQVKTPLAASAKTAR